MTDVFKETSPTRDLLYGHVIVSTTSPVQLANLTDEMDKGVLIYASPNNSAPVWIGKQNVTTSGAAEGFPILPGTSLTVPVDKLDCIWLISTDVNQDIAWIGV